MYTNITPSPPTGVGVNRTDGVKPSLKEVSEQTAKGEFTQALSSSKAPTVQFDDARALRQATTLQAQTNVASPYSATQLLDLISKQLQNTSTDVSQPESVDDKAEPAPQPSQSKKEKQAKQFVDVANFSSKQSLFELVV